MSELLEQACTTYLERKELFLKMPYKTREEQVKKLLELQRIIIDTFNDLAKVPDFENTDRYGRYLISLFIREMQSYFIEIFHIETHENLEYSHEFEKDYSWLERVMKYEFKPYPSLREQIDRKEINFGYFEVILFLYYAKMEPLPDDDEKWIIKKLKSVKADFQLKLNSILNKEDLDAQLEELQEFKRDLEYLYATFDFYSNLGAEIQTLKDKIEETENEIKLKEQLEQRLEIMDNNSLTAKP